MVKKCFNDFKLTYISLNNSLERNSFFYNLFKEGSKDPGHFNSKLIKLTNKNKFGNDVVFFAIKWLFKIKDSILRVLEQQLGIFESNVVTIIFNKKLAATNNPFSYC
jgi:hypothetical protein